MSLTQRLTALFKSAARGAESEANVAENNSGTPTAPNSADLQASIDKAVADAVGAALKSIEPTISKAVEGAVAKAVEPVTSKLADLEKNQGVLADTLKKAPPADADAIAKVVDAKLAATEKARSDAAAKAALRDPHVKALKDKGVPDELINAHLPADSAGDEAAYKAAADKAVLRWNELAGKKGTDNPGTAGDGGKTPGQAGTQEAGTANAGRFSGLSPGTLKYAQSIKLPGNSEADAK